MLHELAWFMYKAFVSSCLSASYERGSRLHKSLFISDLRGLAWITLLWRSKDRL